jgi:hypothetical protein
MKILVRGCNNRNCSWWKADQCQLPESGISSTGIYAMTHEFDYDHVTGKLACVNCLTGDD